MPQNIWLGSGVLSDLRKECGCVDGKGAEKPVYGLSMLPMDTESLLRCDWLRMSLSFSTMAKYAKMKFATTMTKRYLMLEDMLFVQNMVLH